MRMQWRIESAKQGTQSMRFALHTRLRERVLVLYTVQQ